MLYTIESHNDDRAEFVINHRGYYIVVDYPGDVQAFDEMSMEDIDLLVSGYIAARNDLPDFVEPAVEQITKTEWF